MEFKKILRTKSTWILLTMALLLSVLLACLPLAYCYSSYEDDTGNEVSLTGRASIAYEKQQQADAAGVVTPERVRAAVEKPFVVYPGFTSSVMDYQNIMGFLVLLFCVVIAAPVFSADYQSGADEILRCTKYGRCQLGVVKIITTLCISGVAFMICSVVYIFTANSLFGWDCTKTSIQMVYSIITLTEMNMGQLQWYFAFAGLLSILAAVSLTLFCLRNTATQWRLLRERWYSVLCQW